MTSQINSSDLTARRRFLITERSNPVPCCFGGPVYDIVSSITVNDISTNPLSFVSGSVTPNINGRLTAEAAVGIAVLAATGTATIELRAVIGGGPEVLLAQSSPISLVGTTIGDTVGSIITGSIDTILANTTITVYVYVYTSDASTAATRFTSLVVIAS
jgi:hypothetical protein